MPLLDSGSVAQAASRGQLKTSQLQIAWKKKRKSFSDLPSCFLHAVWEHSHTPWYTFGSLYSTLAEPTGWFGVFFSFPWYFCNSIISNFLLPVHQPLTVLWNLPRDWSPQSVNFFSQSHNYFGHRKFNSKMLLFWLFQNDTPELPFQGKCQDFIWCTICSLGKFQWEKKLHIPWI